MGFSAFSSASASTLAAIGSAMPRWGWSNPSTASTLSPAFSAVNSQESLNSISVHGPLGALSPYCQAIPSLRASHPLAGSAARGRGRRYLSLVKNNTSTDVVAAPAKVSRLRVLREFEPGAHPAAAGRMVISGRMVDVCAELDRMVSAETGH